MLVQYGPDVPQPKVAGAVPARVPHAVLQGDILRALKQPEHVGADDRLEEMQLVIDQGDCHLGRGHDADANRAPHREKALDPRVQVS